MKRVLSILILIVCAGPSWGQSGLAFYHMGSVTPQSNQMNPVFFPDAKVYVSLPGISGVSFNLNNAFAYSDILTEIPNDDHVLFNVDNLLSKIGKGDFLNMNMDVSLFQFGLRLGDKQTISIFANERVSGGMLYPRDFLEFAWRGNGDFVGETFTERNLKASLNWYREIGIGYTRRFQIMGTKTLTVGARIKTLQGIVNVKTADNLALNILTNSNRLDMNVTIDAPAIFTAGIEKFEDEDQDASSYIMSNSNGGVGFDLGAEMQVNDKLTVALGINDLGKINWKEGIKNYTASDQTINYEGIDLKDLDDVTQELEDTLRAKFNDQRNTNPYSSSLNTRTFIGATYQILPNSRISASISNVFILDKANTTIGVGFTQSVGKVLTASATISKKSQQAPAIGGGFAVRLGFFQLYTAFDNLLGYSDVRNMQNVDFRFGINFLFGRFKPKAIEKTPTEELGPFPPGFGLEEDGDDGDGSGLF